MEDPFQVQTKEPVYKAGYVSVKPMIWDVDIYKENEFTKHINFDTYKHAYILRKKATKLQINIYHTKSRHEQQSKVDLNW